MWRATGNNSKGSRNRAGGGRTPHSPEPNSMLYYPHTRGGDICRRRHYNIGIIPNYPAPTEEALAPAPPLTGEAELVGETAPAEEAAPAGEAAVHSAAPTKGKTMTRTDLALARSHSMGAEAQQLGCKPGDLPAIASYPCTLLSAKPWAEEGERELQWQAADSRNAKMEEAGAEGLAKMEKRKQRRCNEQATRGKRANVPRVVPPVEAATIKAAKAAAPTETAAAPTEVVTPDVPPTNSVGTHSAPPPTPTREAAPAEEASVLGFGL